MRRRTFIRLLAAAPFLVSQQVEAANFMFKSDSDLEKKAFDKAGSLARAFDRPSESIGSLKLTYYLRLLCDHNVTLKSEVSLWMERLSPGTYRAGFAIEEPVGEGPLDKLLMNVAGYHTKAYQDMLKSISLELDERFTMASSLKSRSIEEILKERFYPNQTETRVERRTDSSSGSDFYYFWKDKTKENWDERMPYDGQVLPMAGFFNYVLFEDPRCQRSELRVVNTLKRATSIDGTDRKDIQYLFTAEQAFLDHTEPCSVSFAADNFMDIMYRGCVFKRVTKGDRLNIPYSLRVDGIISKELKSRKLARLERLGLDEQSLQHEMMDMSDVLAARNVRAYLLDYCLQWVP